MIGFMAFMFMCNRHDCAVRRMSIIVNRMVSRRGVIVVNGFTSR